MRKVVLITGVSSGFGYAIAQLLSKQGHLVYGTNRKEHLEQDGINILKLDVTRPEEIENAVRTIISREGRIDVLINNAGFGIAGALEDFSEEEALLEINTNLLGVYRCCKYVIPHMRKQGFGTIITIGSIAGLMGIPFQGFYAASKFGVEGFMQSLRYEVQPFGVKVVMVNPGDFNTGFTANRKMVRATATSDYQQPFRTTLNVIEKDESGGLKPHVLAKKVAEIVASKNPRHRYIVASFDQKLAVILSKIMPAKWFTKLIAGHYKT
ncbi:MAG: SDR family oxidoreductase [Bacteroidales bacterium]|nr:SDR family oxidoreductase [Bacteroidales bacterium]